MLCTTGHTFDLARQGYLNLLRGPAPRHADTADMVAARERFLGRGLYDPLLQRLRAQVADSAVVAPDRLRLLEAGAGTAYYLAGLLEVLGGCGWALDIAAAASRRAARALSGRGAARALSGRGAARALSERGAARALSERGAARALDREDERLGAVVADVWARLPVRSACVDVVLSVFAPRNAAEFARVLKPEGILVVATPTAAHLAELRGPLGLLQVEEAKDDRLQATLGGRFDRETAEECRYAITVDAATAADLVAMGPNAFHVPAAQLTERVGRLQWPRTVTVDVTISGWRPTGG